VVTATGTVTIFINININTTTFITGTTISGGGRTSMLGQGEAICLEVGDSPQQVSSNN
jgi:hypothetical protein